MPERTFFLLMQHLRIGNGSLTNRAPVDDFGTLIDIAFFIEVDKTLQNRMRAALIHGKTNSVPIRRGTHLMELVYDSFLILILPLPSLLQKSLSSEIMLIYALFLQHIDHFNFRRDGCMVRSWLPERFIALHSLKTN